MSYAMEHPLAIRASESARAAFIRRTYAHLAGAILAFVALETAILNIPGIGEFVLRMVSTPVSWLLVLGAFIGVSWLADSWARSEVSRGMQYLGLGLYVVAEAVIFLPILYIAVHFSDPNIIPTAGILTLAVFAGLTATVFITRKDYSFLAPVLCVGGFLALGGVIAAVIIGSVTFGLVLAFFIVGLACVSILYQTSAILHHYRTDQHVAASLGLFAAVATLFYQILWILLASGRE
jgi:FtsH-binding integral membrane protein